MLIVPDAWAWDPANPVLRADPRWYEVLGESRPGENWRDPWVYPDPAATVATGGIWAVTAEPGDDPFDVASAELIVDDRFYVGKLVRDRDGGWVLLAFHHRGPDDTFVGAISDPMPVVMTPDGLRLG